MAFLCKWLKKFLFSKKNETLSLRSSNHLAQKNIRTTQYGTESVSGLGTKLWELFPSPYSKIKLEIKFDTM